MEMKRKRMTEKSRNINARVGKNLRMERKSRGMSVEELAEIVGLSSAFIALIERGERGTTLENLEILCNVFQTNLNDLVATGSTQVSEAYGMEDASLELKIKTINTYLYNMTSEELDFIINVLKDFRKYSATQKTES